MIGFENLNLKIRKFINFAVKILKDVLDIEKAKNFMFYEWRGIIRLVIMDKGGARIAALFFK